MTFRGGYPPEQFWNRFSRTDELMVVLIEEIKKLNSGLPSDGGGVPGVSERIKNLQITVVPLGVANNEVKYQFALGTKSFIIHARNGNEIRMSTQQGVVSADPATESRDPRFTLKANTNYSQDDLNIRDFTQTFYFACGAANEVLEIIISV
jgi:hypothetical protein